VTNPANANLGIKMKEQDEEQKTEKKGYK